MKFIDIFIYHLRVDKIFDIIRWDLLTKWWIEMESFKD